MDKVGEGGMAVVYRAVDELLGRPVAVKMLRDQFTADREFVERFRREAQAAASLSHPNVVQVFDVGQDNGAHYIVMEFVDGKSLKQVLQQQGRLSPEAAVAVALSVAKALAHAHRHGLIHRDIKPHNILITAEGLVKVADFGIARAASASSLTDSGTVLGSVHYFSPEQARGQSIGAASDIYSLGIVLYEMLTGTVPFTADSPIAIAVKHINDPVPPLRPQRADIPPGLERCVLHALAKSSQHRPASADAFYEELRRAVPEAEEFPTVTLVQRPANAPRKRPAAPEPPPALEYGGADGAATRVVPRAPAPLAEEAGHDEQEAHPATATIDPSRRGKRLIRWAFAAAFLVGLAWWGSARVAGLLFPQEVLVPNIVGLSEAEAKASLAKQGLLYAVDQGVYSENVAKGYVIRQDPEAGRRVREGRKIWVTISLGPQVGAVPDVVGKTLREAQLVITQSGFVLGGVSARYDPRLPANTVVLQEPAAGSELEKGRPVNLVVARGDQPVQKVTIPDLIGLPLDEVRSRLQALGLSLGVTWAEYDQRYPPGTVIDQNPAPGSEVDQGSSVDLIYSQASPSAGGQPAEETAAGGQKPAEPQPPAPPEPAGKAPEQAATETTSASDAAAGAEAQKKWRTAEVNIQVPWGEDKEVVILVIDDFGSYEVFRRTLPGGTYVVERVRGRGSSAHFQVYIGGRMVKDEPFPPAER